VLAAGFVLPLEHEFTLPSSKDHFIKPESDDDQRSNAEMESDDEQQASDEFDDDGMLPTGYDVKAEDDDGSRDEADDEGEGGYGGNAAAAAAAAAAAGAAVAAAGSGLAFGFSYDGDEYDEARMRDVIILTTQTTFAKYSSSGKNLHATRLRINGRIKALLECNEEVDALFRDVNQKCGVKKRGQALSASRKREVDDEEAGERRVSEVYNACYAVGLACTTATWQ
jgi:hypothetical protein